MAKTLVIPNKNKILVTVSIINLSKNQVYLKSNTVVARVQPPQEVYNSPFLKTDKHSEEIEIPEHENYLKIYQKNFQNLKGIKLQN